MGTVGSASPGGPFPRGCRAAGHGAVAGGHVELALLVAADDSDRVGLDDEVLRQPLCLLLRCRGGGFVRVPDGDESCHGWSTSLRWSSATPAAPRGGVLRC